MKMRFVPALCMVMIAAQAGAADKAQLKTDKDRNSYVIGIDIGNSLKQQPLELDAELIGRGIKDALAGAQLLLSEQELKDALTALQKELMAKQQAMAKEKGEKNKKEGEAFLAKNKKAKGVKTTKSGLQYKVLSEGTGAKPAADSTVTVHYKGTLIDGSEFDSSHKRGQPATFAVNGVIPGWTEALQLMKEGSKYQIFIPAELAYGERGAGAVIGPNAVLIFEVELLSIGAPGSMGAGHP